MKSGLDDTAYSLDILRSMFQYMHDQTNQQDALNNAEVVESASQTVKQVGYKLEDAQNWKVFNHNSDMEVIKAFIVDMEFMR